MTYKQKIQRVIDKLEDSGYDSEYEWAESILRAIGITEKFPDGQPSYKEQGGMGFAGDDKPTVNEETADEGSFGFH